MTWKSEIDRPTQIVAAPDGGLIVGTLAGRIVLLDRELRVVDEREVWEEHRPLGHRPIYALAADGADIYARSKAGSLVHLKLSDGKFGEHRTAPAEQLTSPERAAQEDVSPTMIRGIVVTDDALIMTNGYIETAQVDRVTLELVALPTLHEGLHPIEDVVTTQGRRVISDRFGFVHILGELPALFENVKSIRADGGNSHQLIASSDGDHVFVTTDAGLGDRRSRVNGVTAVRLADGELTHYDFTRNDVETICRIDAQRIAVGGFDAELIVLEESSGKLSFDRALGPFTHQIIKMVLVSPGQLAVLCQDGTLCRVDVDSGAVDYAEFSGRQAIWDLAALDDETTVLATDGGLVELEGSMPTSLPQDLQIKLTSGLVRRIEPLGDYVVGLSWPTGVFRHDGAETTWETDLTTPTYELAVGSDVIAVATHSGLFTLDFDGNVINRPTEDVALWSVADDGAGGFVIGGRDGVVRRVDNTFETIWEASVTAYTKRIEICDGFVGVTGHTGLTILRLEDGGEDRWFRGLLENTVEAFCAFEGSYAAVSYGMQLGWFEHETTEHVALYEGLPDFPKAVWVPDPTVPEVCVAGRGGYVQRLRLNRDQFTFDLIESSVLPSHHAVATMPRWRSGSLKDRYALAFA